MLERHTNKRRAGGFLEGAMLAMMGVIAFVLLGSAVLRSREPEGAPDPTPVTPDPAPATDVQLPDLSWLWVTLGVVGAVALIAALVAVTVLVVRKSTAHGRAVKAAEAQRAKEQAEVAEALRVQRAERLATHRARHHELSALYGKYLTDPLAVLRRPLLNDVTADSTARFVEAYAALTALGVADDASDDVIDHYRRAVQEAWQAWRSADAEATRVGDKVFSREDRKRIKRAIDLLRLASDAGASEFERDSALKQANKLIAGLVTLPREAVLTIEAAVRPALQA